MTAQQLPLTTPAHNNQQLFSDHYLNSALPRRPDWQMFAASVELVRERIAAIYTAYTPSGNEAQTERALVQPILEALGHTFEVQAALRAAPTRSIWPSQTRSPDHALG